MFNNFFFRKLPFMR